MLIFGFLNHAMNKDINKICKLICSVNFVGNKSCDYKTQGFGVLIKSCYFLHDELALKSPKQQPTPQSRPSSCSLDMLLKACP